jgi:hypothetical protein
MDPVAALLPQDVLVAQTDVIPGLRRFDLAGNLSTALKGCLNTLATPLVAPACAADLAGVRVVVPQALHQLLAVLPLLLGMLP